MAIKVKDVLEIAGARGCTLEAGQGGLSRIVRYVDSIEPPDMESWMRPNVLYITTGYACANDPSAILRLIKNLHKSKAAALAIKPRFMESFPEEALEEAESLDFPVILIPEEMPFVELNYPVMEAIVKSQNSMMDVMKSRMMKYNKRMMDKDLFVDLLAGNIGYIEEINHRTGIQNWPQPPYQVIILELEGFGEMLRECGEEHMQELLERTEQIIRECLQDMKYTVVVMSNNDSFPCILPRLEETELEKARLLELRQRLCEKTGQDIAVGASGAGGSYLKFEEIYQEAREAADIARTQKTGGRVIWIEDAGFWRLLKEISQQKLCRDYVAAKLEKLVAYDKENDSQLLHTLEVLVENLGVRNTTASSLYLHRNTLMYRIKKVENLTGYDLSDPNSIYELAFALRLRRFL